MCTVKQVGIVMGCLLVAGIQTGWAGDWYVKSGATGDGSAPDKPMPMLWKALDKAVRGDVIHVAQGVYNGKGGSGHFVVGTPELTLVGGYNDDFSARQPFTHLTILERAPDFKGDWTGLPESGAIIAGQLDADHARLTVDGFVLNGFTRNTYNANGDINTANSYKGAGIATSKADTRILNCVILNPLGDGIYCAWQGANNEVANTLIVNAFYNAVSTRSAQPDSVVKIKNCTVAFCWFYPSKGGGIGCFVGRLGKTILEDNVFMGLQTEGGEAGYAVANTFGNDETEMRGNVFSLCQGGYYKYMDGNKQSLLAWKPDELADLNDDGEPYTLAASGGNQEADPGLKPDKDFLEKFSNFVASDPGKLNMGLMNAWRRSVGLPLQAEPGSARKNYGMAYPVAALDGLFSTLPGKGARKEGPFAAYKSASGGGAPAAGDGAAGGPATAYETVEFAAFKKDAPGVKAMKDKPVAFKGSLGPKSFDFFFAEIGRDNYDCYKIAASGVAPDTSRDVVFLYVLRGSEAAKGFEKSYKKKDKVNAGGGAILKGHASYIGKDTYNFPVGIVLDAMGE
jgi:hypothetical protein